MCIKTNEHIAIYLLAIRSPRRVSCVGENHPQFKEQKGSLDSVRGGTHQSARGAFINRVYNADCKSYIDSWTNRYPLQFGTCANTLLIILAATESPHEGVDSVELREAVPIDSDSPARLVVDRLH